MLLIFWRAVSLSCILPPLILAIIKGELKINKFGDGFLRCEVCGRRIFGEPQKVLIERAKMTVCENCAKLGSIRWKTQAPKLRRKTAKPPLRTLKSRRHTTTSESLELVEDFSLQVRQKREKLGLSHEDLGRKIGEKVRGTPRRSGRLAAPRPDRCSSRLWESTPHTTPLRGDGKDSGVVGGVTRCR